MSLYPGATRQEVFNLFAVFLLFAFAAVVIGIDGEPDFSVEFPREKVIWNRVNPTGRGVIFIQGSEVICFVPGMGM